METLDCITWRRSVRKYKPDIVEFDKIGDIIYAAMHAPSSGNLQNWKFIIVDDAGARKALSEACMRQLWMTQAPYHIVVCGEHEKAEQFYGIRGDRLYTIQNCAAAVQNMLLAAYDLGLGSCWVGAFNEEEVRDICGIPGNIRPQAIVTIGYPAEEPKDPPWKHEIYTVAFLNGYGGRMKDPDHVLGYHSKKVHNAVNFAKNQTDKGIDSLKKHAKRLTDKGKDLYLQYKDKARKKS
jgi:nitroreductase